MTTRTRWTLLKHMIEAYDLGVFCTNDATQSGITTLSDDSVLGGARGARWGEHGCDARTRQNTLATDAGTNAYGEGRVSVRPTFSAGQITMDPGPGATALPET